MMEAKRILFLLRHAPYVTSHALEALETVLVAGVFDQRVSVLFLGDGVWQLVKDQAGDAVDQRTIGRVLTALPEYDVTDIYVCRRALEERGLDLAALVLPATVVGIDEQRTLLAAQDAVVND